MDLYAEHILAHSKHPVAYGLLTDADCTHTEQNPTCGDTMTLSLKLTDNHIAAVGWEGEGCAISRAAASILAEQLQNIPLAQAEAIPADTMQEWLGVPIGSRRVKCALLALHTLKNSLRKQSDRPPQTWIDTIGSSASA